MTLPLSRPGGPRVTLNVARFWLAGALTDRLLPWSAVAAIAGAATYLFYGAEPGYGWPLALLTLGSGLLLWRRSRFTQAAGGMLLAFAGGVLAARIAAHRMPPFPAVPYHAVALQGRVVARQTLADGVRLVLDDASLDGASFGPRALRVTWRGVVPANLAVGAIIEARARLFPPDPPAIPGGRDPEREAWFANLGAFGYATTVPRVLREVPADWLRQTRDAIAARLMADLPRSTGPIAATLLAGESAAIAVADRDAFRAAGLSHLLAIAGLHIAIVMGLFTLAARALLLRWEFLALRVQVMRVAAVIGLGGGLGYFLLTGSHVPTGRSLAMAALVVLALLTGRRAVSLRGWGLAALVLVLLAPSAVAGPSFQLSFAAVLALIAGYQAATPVLRRLRGDGGWGRTVAHHMVTLALTSLLAGTACLPFIAYHFGAVQPYFVLANLVAVPLTAMWVMPLGLLALPLMPLGLEWPVVRLMGAGLGVILRLARAIAALPAATLPTPGMPGLALGLFAAALALLCLNRRWLRGLAAPPALAAMLLWATATPPDLLLAASGRAYALRADQGLAVVNYRGGDAYTVAVWRETLGARQVVPANCPASACAVLAGPLFWHFGAATGSCAAAIILMRASRHPDCPATRLITHADISANGAYALWLGGHARLRTDLGVSGIRPWTREPGQRRFAPALPMAPMETLP